MVHKVTVHHPSMLSGTLILFVIHPQVVQFLATRLEKASRKLFTYRPLLLSALANLHV